MAGFKAQASPFNRDKAALLRAVLDRYDVRYRSGVGGNQRVRCLNSAFHPNGDRNPSASISLRKGLYHCFACGLSGDGYDLMKELEGMGVKQVNDLLDAPEKKEEPDWLI